MDRVTGSPEEDGRTWHLYKGPVSVRNTGNLRFKAWRLGFRPSEESRITVPAETANTGAH